MGVNKMTFDKKLEDTLKMQEDKEEIQKCCEYLLNLPTFLGGLEDYERFVGYQCEIVDTTRLQKFVKLDSIYDYNLDYLKRMKDEHVEAFIHYFNIITSAGSRLDFERGTPVRKKPLDIF